MQNNLTSASTAVMSSVSVKYAPGGATAPDRPVKTELMAGLMRCMSRLVEGRSAVKLLDLGCGVGQYTIPLAKNLGYHTIGADCSNYMLELARRKPAAKLVQWEKQDATSLTYDAETFDIVFMSNLLDLIKRPSDVVSECFRVLKPGGALVYHYAALEDILTDPEHKFFPEIVELGYLRTPARKQVETWFKDAHLADIKSQRDTYKFWKNSQEHLVSIEDKESIALTMLSFNSFNDGLSRLRSYTASNPMDPWLLEQTFTTTCGKK